MRKRFTFTYYRPLQLVAMKFFRLTQNRLLLAILHFWVAITA